MIPFNGADPAAYERAGLNARALKVSSRGEGGLSGRECLGYERGAAGGRVKRAVILSTVSPQRASLL